jgi:plasmid stabilization system protein ParE
MRSSGCSRPSLGFARRYLAAENPRAALAFLSALEALEADIGRFPEMGYRTTQPGVLMLPLLRFHYRVFYRIVGDEIRTVRLRHTARRPLK